MFARLKSIVAELRYRDAFVLISVRVSATDAANQAGHD